LLLPSAHWTNAGIYRVMISNALGVVAASPTVVTMTRPPLRLDAPALQSPQSTNRFQLRLLGASGAGEILILSSTNLVDWTPALTNSPAVGTVDFGLDWSLDAARCFYRAVELPLGRVLQLEPVRGSNVQNGLFPICVTGLTARGPVTIYASSDLISWTSVHTNPPTVGPLYFQEAGGMNFGRRFYRAVEAR
jgi:hypothetical protein